MPGERPPAPRRVGRWVRLLFAACVIGWTLVPHAHAGDELSRYLAQPDASYAFHILRTGRLGTAEYLEAILTSQTWRGILWKHQLFIVRPRRLDVPATQALLFIDGGSWNPQYDSSEAQDLPREAGAFVHLADALRAPVGIVRQVPFEPLFDGRSEDALIPSP